MNQKRKVELLGKALPIMKYYVGVEMRRRRLRAHIEFDDLWSEACLRIWQKIARYDSSEATLDTFVRYHVRKAVTEYVRFWVAKNRTTGLSPKIRSLTGIKSENDRGKKATADIVDPHLDPETAYIRTNDMGKFIRICCTGMPKRYPSILWMFYGYEREVNEISRTLGVTSGRVSQMKKEAINKFLVKASHLRIVRIADFYPRPH